MRGLNYEKMPYQSTCVDDFVGDMILEVQLSVLAFSKLSGLKRFFVISNDAQLNTVPNHGSIIPFTILKACSHHHLAIQFKWSQLKNATGIKHIPTQINAAHIKVCIFFFF